MSGQVGKEHECMIFGCSVIPFECDSLLSAVLGTEDMVVTTHPQRPPQEAYSGARVIKPDNCILPAV